MKEISIFAKTIRIIFINELFGSEQIFLKEFENTIEVLYQNGFDNKKEINCCTCEVRTNTGLKKLYQLVQPKRFSFSLEFFTARNKFMSNYKGISMEKVKSILHNARNAGFDEIQLNYIAGIDSPTAYQDKFEELRQLGLVDSVGLSTFIAFNQKDMVLRNCSAWNIRYYFDLVNFLSSLGITFFRPDTYDMGCPCINSILGYNQTLVKRINDEKKLAPI